MLMRRNQVGEMQVASRRYETEVRSDSLLEIAWRQKGIVTLCVVICLICAAVYLLVATPLLLMSSRLSKLATTWAGLAGFTASVVFL